MTALITGASSGIGKAFAERLARDGHDLIIVARRESKLKELAAQIRKNHAVNVIVEVVDLANRNEVERLAGIVEQLGELELLINNAGFGTSDMFIESDPGMQAAMLDVHIVATMLLTRAALPGMIARRHGNIINVSSIASFMSGSHRANYCASKAYLNSFTKSVQDEVRAFGISMHSLCPGFTYTEFHDTDEFTKFERTSVPKFMWMTAEDVVDTSLKALRTRKTMVIPGLQNKLIVAALKIPPLRWAIMRSVRQRQQ